MPHISIISASVRLGRNSHRVAMYFNKYLAENNISTVEILDLKEYNFPLFDERLSLQKNPTKQTLDFAQKVKNSDGVIIVTPEYNGGYPASLKNVVDLLLAEWLHKPIAIATISSGAFGGLQSIISLQFSLWKMKAWTITEMFPVPNVQNNFDELGNALDKENTDKRAGIFIKELVRCIEINTN